MQAELDALRKRDSTPMDAAEREIHQRRKAELKYNIKHGITPKPPPAADGPSVLLRRMSESLPTSVSLPSLPPLPSGDISDAISNFPTFSMPATTEELGQFGGTVSFGTVMGFCTGYALKQAGKAAAVTGGAFFMGLTAAEKAGFVTVHWEKVKETTMKQLDLDGSGTVDTGDAKYAFAKLVEYMTENNSAVTGTSFAGGLLWGLRRG